jgi:hypothetical protein
LIDDTAALGIPQKRGTFDFKRYGGYPVGGFIKRFPPMCSDFQKESGESPGDPVLQEFQYSAHNITVFRCVQGRVFTRSNPFLQLHEVVGGVGENDDRRWNVFPMFKS